MKYKHILFDIDGTLVDNESAVINTWQQTLEELLGKHFEKEELGFVLGIVKDLLNKSIFHQSNVFIWLISLFTSEEGSFSLDTDSIKSFWENKDAVITFVKHRYHG